MKSWDTWTLLSASCILRAEFMEIHITFACCEDYLGETENGRYDVPDNCSIDGVLSHLESHFHRRFVQNLPQHLAFIVNGKYARHHQKLSPDDSLIIFRKIYGG